MNTKTITIKVPVPSNPLKSINIFRKELKIALLEKKMERQYAKGDAIGAWITNHQIKNV